jgi:hypothetical protein
MKQLAAVCPLCQCHVVLGPAHKPRDVKADEALVVKHLETHTLYEWVECTQGLRDQIERRDELSRVPYWAMPRA